MLLIKHPIQGGAAGTHTFSKLSFSQILRTRPSLNCNCTHSEIYRPVPSLAGTPVPVLLPFGTLEVPPPPPPPPPPLANKTADMTSNNANNKAEYLKYLFIVFFNKNKIKASTCNLKSAE